jgi:uncharacterized protein YecE (DUF72 family)
MKGKVFVGTSGWVYKHWNGVFYPDDLNQSKWLEYFAKNFKTAEINNSFYHLPEAKTFRSWYDRTPPDFIFSVKVSRYITHIKRLKGVKSSWVIFYKRAANLKNKLGPFLFQFPSSFKFKEETYKRLSKLLEYTSKDRLAFEFRDPSWFNDRTYELLNKFGAALVIADSSIYPKTKILTSDFIYIRMHGPKGLFSSEYPLREIDVLGSYINSSLASGKDVYVYFNNDYAGFAVKNAKQLELKLAHLPVV